MAVEWKKLQYNDPRITSIASSATPTPNVDTTDLYIITALSEAATFGVPAGTPKDGQKLLIRIKDDGTARSLSWNAIYAGDNLPDTTVISTIMYLACIYNSDASKWDTVSADATHALGGENHTADTLANLNTKISDATLLDASEIIQSNPTSGQYRITGIRLDADKKIVITYDETPIE